MAETEQNSQVVVQGGISAFLEPGQGRQGTWLKVEQRQKAQAERIIHEDGSLIKLRAFGVVAIVYHQW